MQKFLTLLFVLLSFNLLALDLYDSKNLFVKMSSGSELPSSSLIKKSKNLFGDLYLVETNQLFELEKVLKENPNVIYTQKNFKSLPSKRAQEDSSEIFESIQKQLSEFFGDPRANRVWSFRDASDNGVSVNKAYETFGENTFEPIIVAVVDTGVDYNHEDLKDNMWINANEIPGNGLDDDNNGYVDDIHGINTLNRDSQGRATGDISDSHSHGTHVSGTIGAVQNNDIGIAGIASRVRIMGIRTVPNRGDETDKDVVESFLYAAKHGAKVINCSFGKRVNEGGLVVQDTMDHIGKKYGVLVVAAAGNDSSNNDSSPKYPASFESENLLVVASTTSYGGLSYFSNYGIKSVDIAAPGSGIYSTTPNNRYSSMSGTSMASPTTAGVVAEFWSRNPELTFQEVKSHLMKTVTPVDSFKGRMVSGGRVDLFSALDLR